ncbi:OsmC family protein [Cryobacterium psychrophilum]|uniref:OsmC family peroxiredoxin n=1 Tax=Cryobacterium psychrophilum TaxID=41988 RepID=A0A4Y8KND5_9MICO|nr:OsmC family protein [Cryobacterium psychrophilum]TDW31068.1 putative OsmC-like protein [Cryobacterium psychrophilum]TFD78631.1 OsmC family peroxiredoxin [Cryobacterium psychrophilum]
MTLTAPSAPTVSADERATRLVDAGTAWSTRIADREASAHLSYTVTGDGVGSVATRVTAGKHVFFVDEPAALAGDDSAASPVELALGALVSCQIVVYRLYAQNLGIRVDSISAQAEGDLDARGLFGIDDTVRPGFSAVRVVVSVTGPESDERYGELQAAVDAHCPVLDLFSNATPVTVTLLAN